MTTFQSFEDIESWQEARVLTRKIREICKRKNACRDFAFVDQITRSVRSVSANIAEGFEAMSSMQFIEFLGIAKRSCGETRSHLYDALDEQYVSQQEFSDLAERTRRICKMIAGLIHYLQSIDRNQKRTLKHPVVPTRNQKPVTKNSL